MLVATVAVVSSFFVFSKLGSEFMPNADPGQFQVAYKARPGLSLDRSAEIARAIESEIRHNPAVVYTYTTIGGTAGKPINEGNIFIRLTPRNARKQYRFLEAEVRQAMARAVIGGLITSTLLTLVVVPVVYTYLDDAGERFLRWWGHGVKELEPAAPVPTKIEA